jgi:hypothetical protein
MFAHPGDVRRAVEYGLEMGRDPASMRSRPGEVFGTLAYGHPFLDGNGRSLMTVHADLARRAGFHIAWQDIGKAEFLSSLTEELRKPGGQLERLLASHIVAGPLPLRDTAACLSANPDLNPTDRPAVRPEPQPGLLTRLRPGCGKAHQPAAANSDSWRGSTLLAGSPAKPINRAHPLRGPLRSFRNRPQG